MLDKDIIKRRLESGITFCEFAYTLLQGLDFVTLNKNYGVTLQVAGSDQWGNITTGIELSRKMEGPELYGMTMPLVLDANGVKFGKTEGNALWLDKTKTSSYELFQYLINSDDACVIDYLKKLTFLTKEEIESIEEEQKAHPEERKAQNALAREVITFLHGEDEYNKALKIIRDLFSGNIKDLTIDEIRDGFKDVPSFSITEDLTLIDLLVNNSIASSKREAREFINAGSITINGEKVTDESVIIDKTYAIENEVVVIRRGKKKYYLGIIK